MRRLLILLPLLAALPAVAQTTAPDPDPQLRHVLTVFETNGQVKYRLSNQTRDDYAWLIAGGELIVRATDGTRVLVVVGEDKQGVAGAEGKASVEVDPSNPIAQIQARSRREGEFRSLRSTFHPVTVLVCAEETPTGVCTDWQAVPPASGDREEGLILRILDDLYTPSLERRGEDPPLDPDPFRGEDPPLDPDPFRNE